MASAASKTGLEIEIVAAAKDAGCGAFRARGDVDCDALIAWLSEHPEIATSAGVINRNLEEALKIRADRMLKEHKLEVARRGVIPVDEMKRDATRTIVAAKSKMASSEKTFAMKAKMRFALSDEIIGGLVEILTEGHKEVQRELARGDWIMQECPHCKKPL